jgi:plastocyanin
VRRGLSAAAVCAALVLAAGCGSGGSSSTGTAGKPQSKVEVDKTPKYASPSSSEPVKSGTVQIAYRNISINPDTVRVKVGTTLVWTNYDPVEHNVVSKSGPLKFASKNFGEGQTIKFKMTKPGIIHYLCTIHPATMNGTIEVVE